MPVSLVVAAADNDVIGRGGGLPWHLPGDLAHFRRVTLGHPVLMGRRTFAAIGRPLPGRRNLVLSRRESTVDGAEVFADPSSALAAAGGERVYAIGGAAVFDAVLGRADEVFLTRVHATPDGDTHWVFDPREWRLTDSRYSTEDEHPCTFLTYRR